MFAKSTANVSTYIPEKDDDGQLKHAKTKCRMRMTNEITVLHESV